MCDIQGDQDRPLEDDKPETMTESESMLASFRMLKVLVVSFINLFR